MFHCDRCRRKYKTQRMMALHYSQVHKSILPVRLEHLLVPEIQVVPVQEVESDNCTICASNHVNSVFLPCGHVLSCLDCSNHIFASGKPCPICRSDITSVKQIFKV